MQERYNSINAFDNSHVVYSRKTQFFVISWIFILLIGSIIFCVISIKYKYSIFNIYYAKVIKTSETNYIQMVVDSDFISSRNRNYLEINNEEYTCSLINFNEKYYFVNSKKYWEVYYNCNIPDELNVNDNLLEIKVEKRKTTLFNEIIEKIKKGVKNARVKN